MTQNNMSAAFLACFLFLVLIWIIFLLFRRPVNIIFSWILSGVIKTIFPEEDLSIKIDDFGYFCAKGVHISFNKKLKVSISQVLLQFVWEESIFGLKLQSTLTDLVLERCKIEKSNEENQYPCDEERVEIRGSLTLGINLFSFNRPTELLKIAPETETVHGSHIPTSDLTSVWLFGKNAEAVIHKKSKSGEDCDAVFYRLSISKGNALVLYNSVVVRIVVLLNNGDVTCSPDVEKTRNCSTLQVATNEGLVLIFKIVDGVLTNFHSRLKHTEVEVTPLAINTLETLVNEYMAQEVNQIAVEEHLPETTCSEKPLKALDNEQPFEDDTNKCEVAFEAESVIANVSPPDKLKYFELKLAVVGLGSPEGNTTKWSISVPFEMMFFNTEADEKEHVLGSKVKSGGLVNPCVLKAEGEESFHKATKWDVSFIEGMLLQIKPNYVNTLESFIKAYGANTVKTLVSSDERLKQANDSVEMEVSEEVQDSVVENIPVLVNSKQAIFEISAKINEIIIKVLDSHGENLLQVTMLSPQLSFTQDQDIRSLNFTIKILKGVNCLESIPFFHPTEESESSEIESSLALSVVEKLPNNTNKLSFKKFTFGSCNTTVVVEETLIFAILKDFGLHKKVAQIFFERRGEESLEKTGSQRFYFDHLELQAVKVILTLLPAIDLRVDLQVIKNNLGIPHQLPPRFENASLSFALLASLGSKDSFELQAHKRDAFVRNNIEYGSYKYISNDIKKHYLKELGSQSARVLGSMHLLGNVSCLKQDIMSGFTTLRETGEFITFFRQVTSGVASSYSKFAGSWSDLFGINSSRLVREPEPVLRRRHSDPSQLASVAALSEPSDGFSDSFSIGSPHSHKPKGDTSVLDGVENSEGIWLNSTVLPDVTGQNDNLKWDIESGSSDGEGGRRVSLEFIPRNVKRQLKGQEFLRRLKGNLADNEHGEVFACCLKIRKNNVETKLNALLSNKKVFFLNGRPSHESLVLCVKYETLYKAQYLYQDQTHYLQLIGKMKGTRTLSIPTRNPSESPLVRCDNIVIAKKVAFKINQLKKAYDYECIQTQHQ